MQHTNKIDKLEDALKSVKNFKTTIYVEDNDKIKMAQITADENRKFIRSYLFQSPGCLSSRHIGHDTVAEAFTELVNLMPGVIIFPETVQIISENDGLQDMTRAAWCEAFSVIDSQSGVDKSTTPESFCEKILRANLWKKLTGGAAGVQQWNALEFEGPRSINWHNSALNGAKLQGAILAGMQMQNSQFEKAALDEANFSYANISNSKFCGAGLNKANFHHATATSADFIGASLKNANLENCKLQNANFKDADLRKAKLENAELQGADLSTANIEGAKFLVARYDETTVLPQAFSQLSELIWQGNGPDPYETLFTEKLQNLAVETFDEMMEHVKEHFDASRLSKVLKMLKKERFELFSEIQDNAIGGVVKSQSNADLVYSCSLSSTGHYSCGTQNLKQCGGLQGALCKHILVLTIGLARAGKIDFNSATKWILTSIKEEQDPIKEKKKAMTEIFLKYEAATAGEIDWRPTETVPEDYYTF